MTGIIPHQFIIEVVKSEPRGVQVIVKPASIDVKLEICGAAPGSKVLSPRYFPLTPNITTKEMSTGSQATRSY